MKLPTSLIIIMVGLLTLTGCQSTKVKKDVTMPAKVNEMAQAKNIAVTSVTGNQRKQIQYVKARLESFFTGIRVDGKPHFKVIDRSAIDRIIKEQKFSNSDLADERKAVKLGRLVGADTLFSANVYIANTPTEHYEREEVVCVKEEKVEDKTLLGKLNGGYKSNCLKEDTALIPCSRKSINVKLTPKATKVESGQIFYSKTYSASQSSQYCQADSQPHRDDNAMIEASMNEIFKQFKTDVAPYKVTYNIDLMEREKNVKLPKDVKQLMQNALEFAEVERMNKACNIYAQALSRFNQSPAILYNNGICSELEGDLKRAETFYDTAETLYGKPHELISEALIRVQKTLRANQRLEQQHKIRQK